MIPISGVSLRSDTARVGQTVSIHCEADLILGRDFTGRFGTVSKEYHDEVAMLADQPAVITAILEDGWVTVDVMGVEIDISCRVLLPRGSWNDEKGCWEDAKD